MTTDAASGILRPRRPPPWHDPRTRGIFYQILFVAVIATVLGTVMGMARLSSNWLIRKLAQVYVEIFRNIPPLLQLFFWWALLRETAPAPRQAWEPLPGLFISNRGIGFPVPIAQPVHS